MTDADDEIVRKAQSVFSGLHPEQKRIRELEIMAGSVLTEPEIALISAGMVLVRFHEGVAALKTHRPLTQGRYPQRGCVAYRPR